MDKRISGALAWGGLALLVGIPSSEILLRQDSGAEMMAAEVGSQSWAEPEQWPDGKPVGRKMGASQDVPMPEGLQSLEAADEVVAVEEAVSPHPATSGIRAVGSDPRYRIATQSIRVVPDSGLVLEQHASGSQPMVLAAAEEEPINDGLDTPQTLSREVAMTETRALPTNDMPYPAPADMRPVPRVAYTLPSERATRSGFEDDVSQSIANIEARRDGYDDRYADFDVNGSYDDFDDVIAYEQPPREQDGDIFYESDGAFWGSEFEARDDQMLEPFDARPFNGPRHSRRSWRATSRDGDFFGPDGRYVEGERLPAMRGGAVRLDLLQ